MTIKTRYQQLPACFRIGAVALALTGCLAGCTATDPHDSDALNTVVFSASIGDAKEVTVTRGATNDGKGITGTYSVFDKGASLGVYATGGFAPAMKNLQVTKGEGDTWSNNADIHWDSNSKNPVGIKAYFPYGESPATYSLLAEEQPTSGGYRLEDVLVAERKEVSYNNPALFLTFTHRFALLRIKLGNGFDGFTGEVKATMETGIATSVGITDGSINLIDGAATTFVAPTTTGTEYYILIPADAAPNARKVASLALGNREIKNTPNTPDNMPDLKTEPNTIYTLKAQIVDGVPVIRVVGIEAWTDAEYLGMLKAKPGIYTEGELKEFGDAYNKEPKDEAALASFGEKQNGTWIIYLQDNLYLTELDDLTTSDTNESEYTATIVNSFADIFEGQGYSINGLSIKGGNGLFGTLTATAKVNDLILTDASVSNSTTVATGILAGTTVKGSIVTNCHIFGTSASTGTGDTGGLIGVAEGTINRSSSFATVTGATTESYYTGGLVGKVMPGAEITNSFAKGWVTGPTSQSGTLTGNSITTDITVKNCYATVNVNGTMQSQDYNTKD